MAHAPFSLQARESRQPSGLTAHSLEGAREKGFDASTRAVHRPRCLQSEERRQSSSTFTMQVPLSPRLHFPDWRQMPDWRQWASVAATQRAPFSWNAQLPLDRHSSDRSQSVSDPITQRERRSEHRPCRLHPPELAQSWSDPAMQRPPCLVQSPFCWHASELLQGSPPASALLIKTTVDPRKTTMSARGVRCGTSPARSRSKTSVQSLLEGFIALP
jgi:hypothetical protein